MGGTQDFFVQPMKIKGMEKKCVSMYFDADFLDVMKINLLEGRTFSWDRPGDYVPGHEGRDQPYKFLLNETAVREFGLDSPVGYFEKPDAGPGFEIIGVVQDFNFQSQHERIEPTIHWWWRWLPIANIKITPTNMQATLRYIKKESESLFPNFVFDYSFLDETWARR